MMVRIAACLAAVLVCIVPALTVAEEQSMRDRPNATDVGIWKSYSPKGLRGEFNNHDPIGLIAGAAIRTDCSINYTDPDNGKVYCFNTATSLVYFEHWPKTYSRRAAEAFEHLRSNGAGF